MTQKQVYYEITVHEKSSDIYSLRFKISFYLSLRGVKLTISTLAKYIYRKMLIHVDISIIRLITPYFYSKSI